MKLQRRWAVWRARVRAWLQHVQHSLRLRVALGVGLPLLLALIALSFTHYWNERHLLETQARQSAVLLGDVVAANLRHAMLTTDHRQLSHLLTALDTRETVARVVVVNLDGVPVAANVPLAANTVERAIEPGCTTCHRRAVEALPAAAVLAATDDIMRVAVPLNNEAECAGCHRSVNPHLGIVLMDLPMQLVWPHVAQDLQTDLFISGIITLFITGAVYLMLHQLVVRRVEAFRPRLAEFAAGNFGARLPVTQADEIGELAGAFNRMADQLAVQAQQEQAQAALRQHAIAEERERIARELHDGLAQVLGYVHTKATAVRLLVNKGQTPAAEKHLAQLEEAARSVFVDIREAILGLKITSRPNTPLSALINEYADQFSRLSDLPVQVTIAPNVAAVALPTETELQMLRIMQEALANVRKHAQATTVCVHLHNGGPWLELLVSDDGCGFAPEQPRLNRSRPHFGLSTMRERAEAIGAQFHLHTTPGAGTQVKIQLPFQVKHSEQ